MKNKDEVKAEIVKKLNEIVDHKIDFNKEEFSDDFFGIDLSLKPRDLVFLILNMENRFNIKISEESIIAKEVCEISTLTDVIYKYIISK